jgi:oxygen-independent coproporphyrinogen-3 oxidase
MTIGADLIHKYDVLAPRYTSYPSAPQFHTEFGETHYRQHAAQSNATLLPKNLSVYVHIPFCHSLCYFCGCNKVITPNNDRKVDGYLERVFNEIVMRGSLFSEDRLVTQIHFGGGTPNFLRVDQLADILDQIALQFHLDLPSNLEMGIELDPRYTTTEEIANLAKLGFSRFSIGVQDFSSQVQKAINRIQARNDTLEIIAAAKTVGKSVNVDLITGLPHQTIDSFSNTLDDVIGAGVTRIAVYNFAYLPDRIKAQRLLDENALPNPEQRIELTKLTRDKLLGAGYHHIGMDHYALPEDSLAIAQSNNTLQRNFQGYTTHKDTDLVGIGASAISKFDTAFAQNSTSLSTYNQILDDRGLPIAKGLSLNDDDRIRAEVIQQIMCRSSVDLSRDISGFSDHNRRQTLASYFDNELQSLQGFINDGLIEKSSAGFEITEMGRFFMRPIAAVFDRYLGPSISGLEDNKRVVRFSRTV